MAVSMKDVDPVFQGVGNREGTEIWRMENSRAVLVPKSTHGFLVSGYCYIVLQARALKSGVLHHEIFYWLGKSARQDDVEGAAIKAVELDAALGGRAVVSREAEGHETDNFLSYFKPCFLPMEEASLNGANGQHKVRLFLCSGRHVARVKEVPFSRASLSHDDVFILETESKIFQFNGANTDIFRRAKAVDVVKYLKDNFHKKDCMVAVIEDGKFVADADSGEFWGLFGGFAPLGRKSEDDDDKRSKATTASLSCVIEGQPTKIQESSLKRGLLSTSKCYILDCGNELFTWVGRDTQLEERRALALMVEKLIGMRESHCGTHLTYTIEGFEPREFKLQFESWPMHTAVPISEHGRGKVAVLLKHKGFNVKGMLKAAPAKEHSSHFTHAGKLQVWCINGTSKVSVSLSKHGRFFNSNCYIVLHNYPSERKEEYVIYFWVGHGSTEETREVTAQSVKELASSLKGAVEVRIHEGKEPSHFTLLFQNLFIIKGNDEDVRSRLFQVEKSGPQSWEALEVNLDALSLNSSGCFFLHSENALTMWYGKFSTIEEQEATESLALEFHPEALSVVALKEGSESDVFWEALGGRKVHPSLREPKESTQDPHLLSCSIVKGELKATEVFNFTQSDLLSDEVLVLDCHSDVYVWVGQSVSEKVKLQALEIGQKYIEQVARYGGRSLETPLYKILEGSEPSFFRQFFSWDDSKTMQHLNVFQKKIYSLKGQQPVEVRRSMRRHSMAGLESQIEAFSTVAEKSRLTRGTTFKTDNSSPEKTRSASKTRYMGGRSPGSRSPAVSALSSMFEFQAGREMTGEPKLSMVRTKQESSSKTPTPAATPPRTPRAVASPRSPVIAALASMFEPYSDKKLDFAWPGLKPKSEEKLSRDYEARIPRTMKEVKPVEETPMKPPEVLREPNNGDAALYPYERLKVSSSDPVKGIDYSRREAYLSNQDFQDTFRMDKDTFYKLPKWKQDKYKILVDLF